VSKNFKDLMQEITDWQDSVFTQATALSAVTHLQREVIELTFAIQSEQLKKEGQDDIIKELADCFLLVVGVAHLSGIDLEAAAIEKLEINKARVWGVPDADGVVEHVRELPTPAFNGEKILWKGKTLLEIFEADGLLSNAGDIGPENILIKSSAESGGKIFNSPNIID